MHRFIDHIGFFFFSFPGVTGLVAIKPSLYALREGWKYNGLIAVPSTLLFFNISSFSREWEGETSFPLEPT